MVAMAGSFVRVFLTVALVALFGSLNGMTAQAADECPMDTVESCWKEIMALLTSLSGKEDKDLATEICDGGLKGAGMKCMSNALCASQMKDFIGYRNVLFQSIEGLQKASCPPSGQASTTANTAAQCALKNYNKIIGDCLMTVAPGGAVTPVDGEATTASTGTGGTGNNTDAPTAAPPANATSAVAPTSGTGKEDGTGKEVSTGRRRRAATGVSTNCDDYVAAVECVIMKGKTMCNSMTVTNDFVKHFSMFSESNKCKAAVDAKVQALQGASPSEGGGKSSAAFAFNFAKRAAVAAAVAAALIIILTSL